MDLNFLATHPRDLHRLFLWKETVGVLQSGECIRFSCGTRKIPSRKACAIALGASRPSEGPLMKCLQGPQVHLSDPRGKSVLVSHFRLFRHPNNYIKLHNLQCKDFTLYLPTLFYTRGGKKSQRKKVEVFFCVAISRCLERLQRL